MLDLCGELNPGSHLAIRFARRVSGAQVQATLMVEMVYAEIMSDVVVEIVAVCPRCDVDEAGLIASREERVLYNERVTRLLSTL